MKYTSRRLRRLKGRLALLMFMLALAGCQSTGTAPISSEIPGHGKIVGNTVSVAFGPDGRLWRLLPGENFAYVDSSSDKGVTFHRPVRVNPSPQKISASPENPPVISVDESGRVFVLFYADEVQPGTTYFSVSSDGGRHFEPPVRISDHADRARHYRNAMVTGKNGDVHVFWHDLRDKEEDRRLGESVLSLYYATVESTDNLRFDNQKITGGVCSCCRTPVALDVDGNPVLFARLVFEGSIRDHGIIKLTPEGPTAPKRVTFDDWVIEACPEHGPALAISENGRYHFAWFTLGDKRRGIFYARSDDGGGTLSEPMPLGDIKGLPSHPDVLALGKQVVLAWQQYDGRLTRVMAMHSEDGGETWSTARSIADTTSSAANYPKLVTDGEKVFLSWYARDHGYRLIPVERL